MVSLPPGTQSPYYTCPAGYSWIIVNIETRQNPANSGSVSLIINGFSFAPVNVVPDTHSNGQWTGRLALSAGEGFQLHGYNSQAGVIVTGYQLLGTAQNAAGVVIEAPVQPIS